jgi:tetratricopeptide (TPR) repeat protein
MRKLTLSILLAMAPTLFGATGELDRAQAQFNRANYKDVVEILKSRTAAGDPAAHALTGKAWFMLGDYKKSSDAFEAAVAGNSASSEYHHWLGKAYGRRAETSNPLSAPMLASKARQSFERAVELDGRNLEAINDLFSYYMEAPGFLGGGLDKAARLAEKIKPLDPIEYHYDMAQLAEKRKEFKTAEFHFRSAFEMAPKSVGRAIDLARFLSNQGRLPESEVVFAQAAKIDPDSPRLLFERASAYVRAKQNLGVAKQLLERYLQFSLTPDDPPRSEAQRLLKQATQAGA